MLRSLTVGFITYRAGNKRFQNGKDFSQLIEKFCRRFIYTAILVVTTTVLLATQLLTASPQSYQKSSFERRSYNKFSWIKHGKNNPTARCDTLYGYRKILTKHYIDPKKCLHIIGR